MFQSLNAKYKRYTNWEKLPLGEFVQALIELYDLDMKRIFGAFCNQGTWTLSKSVPKKYRFQPETWHELSEEEKMKYLMDFCRMREKTKQTVVRSSDNLYSLKVRKGASSKPNHRQKSSKSTRTTNKGRPCFPLSATDKRQRNEKHLRQLAEDSNGKVYVKFFTFIGYVFESNHNHKRDYIFKALRITHF